MLEKRQRKIERREQQEQEEQGGAFVLIVVVIRNLMDIQNQMLHCAMSLNIHQR